MLYLNDCALLCALGDERDTIFLSATGAYIDLENGFGDDPATCAQTSDSVRATRTSTPYA